MRNKTDLDYKIENALSIIASLNDAVFDAGGRGFSLAQLQEMSAYDLCLLLAPNSIRFRHIRKSYED